MTEPRRIDYLSVLELPEDERNPKLHAEGEIDDAIQRWGYTEPVLIDERTGKLISGHGRREALLRRQSAGEPPPDGILVADDGTWLVPVVRGWASANDDEAAAYLVAANRLTEAGGWDQGPLAALLADLQLTPDGLHGVGYDTDDVDALLAAVGTGELPEADTAADYAEDLSGRGDPAPPRNVQGLHEVGLMFQDDAHREYVDLMNRLRRAWGADLPSPVIVIRALRYALEGPEQEA